MSCNLPEFHHPRSRLRQAITSSVVVSLNSVMYPHDIPAYDLLLPRTIVPSGTISTGFRVTDALSPLSITPRTHSLLSFPLLYLTGSAALLSCMWCGGSRIVPPAMLRATASSPMSAPSVRAPIFSLAHSPFHFRTAHACSFLFSHARVPSLLSTGRPESLFLPS